MKRMVSKLVAIMVVLLFVGASMSPLPALALVTPHAPPHHAISPAGDAQTGWFLNYYNGVDGMQAMFSTMSTFSPNRGTPARDIDLYNTLQVPGESCLEMTAGISYYAGMSGPQHYFGFYNGCTVPTSWAITQEMTSAWKAKYEQSLTYPSPVNGLNVSDKVVTAQILRTSVTPNCWKGQLLNLQTSSWDTIVQNICGTNDLNFTQGWQLFETYGFSTPSSTNMCGQIGTYDVVTLRTAKYHYTNGTYSPVTTFDQGLTNTPMNCFDGGYWHWGQNNGLPTGGDSWIVCGPAAWDIYCDT